MVLKQQILKSVREMDFFNDPFVEGFGIVVKEEMAQCDGQNVCYYFFNINLSINFKKIYKFRTSTARP